MTGFVVKRFVKNLKKLGFRITKENYFMTDGNNVKRKYYHFNVTGLNLKGGVEFIGGEYCLYLDNSKCYDKLLRCPLVLSATDQIPESLIDDIKFLGSEDGYKYSNPYGYLDDDFAKLKTRQ